MQQAESMASSNRFAALSEGSAGDVQMEDVGLVQDDTIAKDVANAHESSDRCAWIYARSTNGYQAKEQCRDHAVGSSLYCVNHRI